MASSPRRLAIPWGVAMGFRRRSLLKATGLTLAGWALEGSGLTRLNRSGAALAAPARRKFALLVGIDQYGNSASCPDLFGCIHDLALQRNLLIHRFGFEPGDILTIQNKQASRSGFQKAFLNHLLGQVTAEDTVFFHFSGYGSTVQTAEDSEIQRSLVLHDSCTSAGSAVLRDLPESTLLLLLQALPTERIVSVLDTGYRLPDESPASEGVRLRTRPSPAPAPFDAQTLQLQEVLQKQLQSRGFLLSVSKSPGVILQATELMPAALEFEGQAGGVGLLTYALSQQLWNTANSVGWRDVMAGTLARLAAELSLVQTPQLLDTVAPGRSLEKSGFKPIAAQGGAGAVLSARNSGDITLWLGGLSSQAIAYCAAGSIFQVISGPSQNPANVPNRAIPSNTPIPSSLSDDEIPRGASDEISGSRPVSTNPVTTSPVTTKPVTTDIRYLKIQQRSGLQAQAKLYPMDEGGPPAVGSLVKEQIRVIPRKLDLAIAIDKRLDRIERVDATSALTAIPRVAVVTLHHEPADYVFGRVTPRAETLVASLPQNLRQRPGSVTLAQASTVTTGSVTTGSVTTGTVTTGTITTGTIPAKESLHDPVTDIEELELPGSEYGLLTLGHEVLLSTLGASSEAIKTAVQRLQPYLETLRAAKKIQLLENSLTTQLSVQSRWELLPATSARSSSSLPALAAPHQIGFLVLKADDRLQYQLKNESDRPLYALVLGLDPRGRWKPWVTNNLISPLAPAIQTQGRIALGKRPGLTELYTVFSISPFRRMYQLLTGGDPTIPAAQADQPIADSYALSEALLQDLFQGSQQLAPEMPVSDTVYRLNLQAWATFRQTCRMT